MHEPGTLRLDVLPYRTDLDELINIFAVLDTPPDLVDVTTFDLSSPPITDSEVGDTPGSMSTIAWSNQSYETKCSIASNLCQSSPAASASLNSCRPFNHHKTQTVG